MKSNEVVKVIKEGLDEHIISYAKEEMEYSKKAKEELRAYNRLNSDIGIEGDFDDLSENLQEELLELGRDRFEEELEELLGDGNKAYIVLKKIIRNLI